MIKAISFDIGGTLVEVDRNSKSIIDKISQTTGIDKNKIKKIFRRNFVEKSNSVFAFCDEINFKNVSVIEHIINEHKSRSKLYPETYEVLNILSSMGYKLITISNDSCWNKKKLNKYDVTKFFVEEIYSYQYGVTKPHISLFNYAQQKLNVNSSEIMHIGDTLHSDIVGANNAGWISVLIDREKKITSSNRSKAKYTIYSLEDLFSIIEYENTMNSG